MLFIRKNDKRGSHSDVERHVQTHAHMRHKRVGVLFGVMRSRFAGAFRSFVGKLVQFYLSCVVEKQIYVASDGKFAKLARRIIRYRTVPSAPQTKIKNIKLILSEAF